MAHFIPVRDAAGNIIDTRPKGEESQFAAMLAETMEALGPEPAAAPATQPAESRSMAIMIALGLVAALILVAGLNLVRSPVASAPPVAPTAVPAPPTRTIAPTAVPSPTSTPTAVPAPPTQTPVVIIQQAPPVQCYSVTLDVTDAHGTPIGVATGESCESQDAARANAEAHAAQVRATHEKR